MAEGPRDSHLVFVQSREPVQQQIERELKFKLLVAARGGLAPTGRLHRDGKDARVGGADVGGQCLLLDRAGACKDCGSSNASGLNPRFDARERALRGG